MNKRIKDLAHQAGDVQNKFAALIIQDCVACCEVVLQAAIEKNKLLGPFTYFDGREDAAALCKSTIQKHFEEGK